MDLRAKPGEFLDSVARDGRSFVIERKGHRIALLVPVATLIPDIDPARLAEELQELHAKQIEIRRTRLTAGREIQLSFDVAVAGDPFTIQVELPHKYPNVPPRVRIQRVGGRQHQREDGTLCLYGEAEAWNPGRDGILRTLQLARDWIEAYGHSDEGASKTGRGQA